MRRLFINVIYFSKVKSRRNLKVALTVEGTIAAYYNRESVRVKLWGKFNHLSLIDVTNIFQRCYLDPSSGRTNLHILMQRWPIICFPSRDGLNCAYHDACKTTRKRPLQPSPRFWTMPSNVDFTTKHDEQPGT